MLPVFRCLWAYSTEHRALKLLACRQFAVYAEPDGSVFEYRPQCFVRRALGCHPTRRSGTARPRGCFDHRPCREVSHDANGHEEARRRLGAGGARRDGESRARADLQTRPTRTGHRGGMDRAVTPALGRTLQRVGQAYRGIKTKVESRTTKQKILKATPQGTSFLLAN